MGVGHEISPEGASYASSMAIEEGCLTAGNVFALISVGMVIIGHPHFSFFAVCVEANRVSAGLSWKLRHFCRGHCMDLVGCRYLKKLDCGIDFTRSSLSQVCVFC